MKIIKLSADWCLTCANYDKEFNIVKDSLKSNKDLSFESVNIESDLGVHYCSKFNVKSIPTTLILDNNELLYRVTGPINSAALVKLILKLKLEIE